MTGDGPPELPPREFWLPLLERELACDLGEGGDVTTRAVVEAGVRVRAAIVARSAGRLCGVDVALAVFELLGGVSCERRRADGADLEVGAVVAEVHGGAHAVLAGERTALNLLSRLSGVATATRETCRAVAGAGARVACTRKTTPGLRGLEKYAVRVGGGENHRRGLYDGVLIKDNHRALVGGVAEAVRRARRAHDGMCIEAEVESLEEAEAALGAGADALLFDNMTPAELRRAVAWVGGRVPTEASGGIRLENASEFASTGVDRLAVGWITHSAPAVDFSLEISPLV